MFKTLCTGALLAMATTTALATTTTTADAQGWYGHRDYERHRPMRCEARALRLGGSGPAVPGVGGIGFGRDACREAMFKCRRELRFIQSHGRAPLAVCEIVGRR